MASRKAASAVILQRQPELERAEAPRQLHRLLEKGEPLHRFVAEHAHIVAAVREGRAGHCRIPIEQAAAVDRLVQPFVRIERQRIGLLQPAKLFGHRQRSESAIGAVDVQPQVLALGDVSDLGQRIDGAGATVPAVARSPSACGPPAGRRRSLPRGRQRACANRRRPGSVACSAADAQQRYRLRDRHVHLFGRVDDARPRTVSLAGSLASRAIASAIRLAAEPPPQRLPASRRSRPPRPANRRRRARSWRRRGRTPGAHVRVEGDANRSPIAPTGSPEPNT